MSDFPGTPGPRPADSHLRLRLAALTAVIIGVVLLAAAAFVVSYSGIHQFALETGVSSMLARLYPFMFDATLVIACAAALALRGARWGMRLYVWLSLLLLLGVAAAADAVQAMAIALPRQPSRAVVAVIPWALLLLAFGLWLAMLRQLRRMHTAGGPANRAARQRGPDATDSVAGTGTAGATPTVTWAGGTGSSRVGIDALMEPRTGRPPAVAPAAHAGQHPSAEPPSAVSAGSRGEPPAASTGEADTSATGTSPDESPEGTRAEAGRAYDRQPGQERAAAGQDQGAQDQGAQDQGGQDQGGQDQGGRPDGTPAEAGQAGQDQARQAGQDQARQAGQDQGGQDQGEAAGDGQAHDERPDGAPAEAGQAGQAGDSRSGAAGSPDVTAPAEAAPFDRLHSSPTRPQD